MGLAGFTTETLVSINDVARFTSVALAVLTAASLALQLFTGKELEKRRKTEEEKLVKRLGISEQAATAAQQDAETLRRRLAPRSVADEDRRRMLDILRTTKADVHIIYVADAEAGAFGNYLRQLLSEAGWGVTSEGATSFGPIIGLSIHVHSAAAAPAAVEVLRTALAIPLPDVALVERPNVPAGAIHLIVGTKPPA